MVPDNRLYLQSRAGSKSMVNNGETSSNSAAPELSVVVLCYRAEETIVPYVEKLEKELSDDRIDYELVLVANYFANSKDTTPEVVSMMSKNNPRIRPVIQEKRGMMGWDLRSGLEAAKGKAIAFIDGDGQMPSFDIVRLYRIFKSWEFDLCKTYRVKRLDAPWRQVISIFFNLLFNIMFPGVYLHDINAKPKILSREAYERMRLVSNDWFADAEIVIEARRLNLIIGEIPTVFYMHRWGKSFVKPTTALEFAINMVRYRFKYWFAPPRR
jgi:glycosyltransferase involved in cell wall biosynthesis